jgi:hypothetical protein
VISVTNPQENLFQGCNGNSIASYPQLFKVLVEVFKELFEFAG